MRGVPSGAVPITIMSCKKQKTELQWLRSCACVVSCTSIYFSCHIAAQASGQWNLSRAGMGQICHTAEGKPLVCPYFQARTWYFVAIVFIVPVNSMHRASTTTELLMVECAVQLLKLSYQNPTAVTHCLLSNAIGRLCYTQQRRKRFGRIRRFANTDPTWPRQATAIPMHAYQTMLI